MPSGPSVPRSVSRFPPPPQPQPQPQIVTSVRRALLDKYRVLLGEVAGEKTPWLTLEAYLKRLPAPILHALLYRIERVLAETYESGQRSGEHSPIDEADPDQGA